MRRWRIADCDVSVRKAQHPMPAHKATTQGMAARTAIAFTSRVEVVLELVGEHDKELPVHDGSSQHHDSPMANGTTPHHDSWVARQRTWFSALYNWSATWSSVVV